MSISDILTHDIQEAMKAKDKVTLEALRAIKSAFLLAGTAQGAATSLSADEELKIVQKLVKQRHDSATIYKEQGRADLYDKEIGEIAVLQKYLPAKLSDAELTAAVKSIIEKTGAKTLQDLGKVMGAATKELAGKADGKEISQKVKELLG